MNDNYHTIIHRPFTDLSGLISLWSSKSEAIACAEHEADDEVPRTHCHILIIKYAHKRDNITKDIHKIFPDMNGQKDFRTYTQTQKSKDPISRQGLWYLLKGQEARLKFQNNFSKQEVEEALKHFDPGQAKREKSKSESEKEKSKLNHYEIIEEIREQAKVKQLLSHTMADVASTQHHFIENYSEIMEIIFTTLNKHRLKFGIFDLEKWFITVVSEDPRWKSMVKDKIFSKIKL